MDIREVPSEIDVTPLSAIIAAIVLDSLRQPFHRHRPTLVRGKATLNLPKCLHFMTDNDPVYCIWSNDW